MAGTITVIRSEPMIVNYQFQVIFGNKSISYCSAEIPLAIELGSYEIPEDQRDNLDWWYDNNFKLNAYGRFHIGRLMEEEEPDTVIVV